MFPPCDADYVLAFQFSSWFPFFSSSSVRSTIVRPLDEAFRDYLESDGVFVPDGSDDLPETRTRNAPRSSLSDDGDSSSSETSEPARQHFAFPELDTEIRAAIDKYGAVFPKLNFSSPKDAAWVLPMSSPLKCTSPADVYILLKSSDFVTHDIDVDQVFDGCAVDDRPSYDLELVLRKWYPVDQSREVRCFVRDDSLLAISQRDTNFYDYMIDPVTQTKIKSTVRRLWEENVRPNWTLTRPDYIFDLLLTRDLSRGHILDFNPYAPRTDPLLFSYEELRALFARVTRERDQSSSGNAIPLDLPEFRVVDSPVHPAATRNAPAHQHNMVPVEALGLTEGRNVAEFSEIWRDELKRAMQHEDKSRAL